MGDTRRAADATRSCKNARHFDGWVAAKECTDSPFAGCLLSNLGFPRVLCLLCPFLMYSSQNVLKEATDSLRTLENNVTAV